MTYRSVRRFTVTLGLWAVGVFTIMGALLSLSLGTVVRLLSLENDMWDRADNPHTLTNVVLYGAIGAAAIFAARSSDRIRFWLGVIAFVVYAVYGMYDLGVFDG